MKRKIVLQGVATHTLSLPIDWIRQQGLQPGDEVNVEPEAGRLIIQAAPEHHEQKVKIVIPDGASSRLIRRYINAPYRQGFDEIKVQFSDVKTVETIQYWLNHWVGLELIEQGKNYCVLRNITGPPEGDFDSIFRRFLLLILESSRETLVALQQQDQVKLKAIIDKDFTINRLYLFCLRLINKKGHIFFPGKETFMYLVINRFEEIADVYRDICRYALASSLTISEKSIERMGKVASLVEEAYKLYYTFEDAGAMKIDQEYDALTKQISQLLQAMKSSKEKVFLHYLLDIVTYVYEVASPIFAVKMKEEVL